MFAGKLDKRILIQKRVVEQDTFGEGLEDWSNLACVWAEIRGISGKEFFESRQEHAEDILEFKIRYRTDVVETNRIYYNNQYYDVFDVKEIGRKEGLMLRGRALRSQ